MIATSGFLTALECTKSIFGLCSAPDPAGGAYSEGRGREGGDGFPTAAPGFALVHTGVLHLFRSLRTLPECVKFYSLYRQVAIICMLAMCNYLSSFFEIVFAVFLVFEVRVSELTTQREGESLGQLWVLLSCTRYGDNYLLSRVAC